MRIAEKICVVIMTIGLLFKISLYPGGGPLVVVGGLILSLLYNFFGFAFHNNIKKIFKSESYEAISRNQIIIGIFSGFSLSACLLGIVFKLQDYPGSSIMLITGISTLSIFFAYLLVKNQPSFKNSIIRSSILLVIGLILFILPSVTLMSFFHRDSPSYVEAYKEFSENRDDMRLMRKLDFQRQIYGLDSTAAKMVGESLPFDEEGNIKENPYQSLQESLKKYETEISVDTSIAE